MFKPVILGKPTSKNRSSTQVETAPASKLYDDMDVLQLTYGGGDVDVRTKVESIVYTNSLRGHPLRFNTCRHSKSTTYFDGTNTAVQVIPDNRAGHSGWYSKYTGSCVHSKLAHDIAVTDAKIALGNPVLGPDWLHDNAYDFINLAAERVKPDLTQLSLPNFFLELDDVRRLGQLWQKGKGLAKNVAGAHLNINFGWKPTIGDLDRSMKTVISAMDRLDEFKRMAGEVSYRRVTLLNDTSTISGSSTYEVSDSVDWSASLTRRVSGHLKFRNLPIEKMSKFQESLRAHMDAFGFQLDAGIIWEAIPFSFVVDWFINIGKMMDRISIDTLELPIEWVDSCLHYKEEFKVASNLHLLQAADLESTVATRAWVTHTKDFYRMPITPNGDILAGIGFELPSLHQAKLLVSLATVLS